MEESSATALESKKKSFIGTSKRLKLIVSKLSEKLKENPTPSNQHINDIEIIQKREEVRKVILNQTFIHPYLIFQKNETIKTLMDRMLQLQFDIQAMMTIGVPPTGWP